MCAPCTCRSRGCRAIWSEPGKVNTILVGERPRRRDLQAPLTLEDLGIKLRTLRSAAVARNR